MKGTHKGMSIYSAIWRRLLDVEGVVRRVKMKKEEDGIYRL
jgi:hypothetical protein